MIICEVQFRYLFKVAGEIWLADCKELKLVGDVFIFEMEYFHFLLCIFLQQLFVVLGYEGLLQQLAILHHEVGQNSEIVEAMHSDRRLRYILCLHQRKDELVLLK
jgi:hypothetical protein